MSMSAISSALEAANWFFRRADRDDVSLSDDKLHHLLFLAQVHYALSNKMQYLMPSLFVCDKNGFFEPTLAQILPHGLPLMSAPAFSDKVDAFLELIWKKYSPLSPQELAEFIKNTDSYADSYQNGRANIVSTEDMAQKFRTALTSGAFGRSAGGRSRKILISQNGPVVVSAWQPRKLGPKNNKETKNV